MSALKIALTPAQQGRLDACWSKRKAQAAFNPYDPCQEEAAHREWEEAYELTGGREEELNKQD